ncbi:MAG TPA: PAAR domain-containing protein, partial [Thermoanaerobaculia bacterium]|nr:PAAR domain-containing protein [Thermoanaerobaculia bacterium]
AAPAAVAAATAARLAAETLKASSAAAMSATIAAAAAGGASIHVCATPWPIPPHGPGVVIDGSATVSIENAPACRQGDTVVEAIGPPNKIVMGCTTVIIGG